jgi:hypothetical protein
MHGVCANAKRTDLRCEIVFEAHKAKKMEVD